MLARESEERSLFSTPTLLLVGSTANFLTDLYSAAPSLDEHHVDLKAGCEQEKGLRRWLCEATVHIPLPPIEVDVPVVGIEVITLDGLACGGVSLGPISSSVDLSAPKPSLSLSAKDASFNCSVKHFTFEQKGGGILKGDGTATMSVGTAMASGGRLRGDGCFLGCAPHATRADGGPRDEGSCSGSVGEDADDESSGRS